MNALAITDHGNMFGIKEFSEICESANDEINKEISKKEESIKTIETKIAEGSATEEEISKIETYKSEILSLQKQPKPKPPPNISLKISPKSNPPKPP